MSVCLSGVKVKLWKHVIVPFLDIDIKNVSNDFASLCCDIYLFYFYMSGSSFSFATCKHCFTFDLPRDPVSSVH